LFGFVPVLIKTTVHLKYFGGLNECWVTNNVKGIVQPFGRGVETRLIRSAVKK
jgi:hypothetical protein